jgi:hypothetical protein
MDVQMPSLQQVSQQVGGARAVQHIRGRGVLGLWMDEQVDQRPQGHNTRHCHLHLNMCYGSRNTEPQTLPLPSDHHTQNEAKVG